MASSDPGSPGAAYVIEHDAGERALVVTGPWSREAQEVLLGGEVETLVLNYARGFEPNLERGELEFLDRGFGVRRLTLLDRGIVDLTPIYRLGDTLVELSVQAAPAARLDLGELPHLQQVSGEWALIGRTLGTVTDLREVITWRFDEQDLRTFETHTVLEWLTLKDAPFLESLDGLAGHQSLRYLEIRSARRLADLSALLEFPPPLHDLRLEKCRAIDSLDPIAALRRLRFLEIGDCGDLPSATQLQPLTSLETLYAWGSTRFTDGDLSALVKLPALKEVRMRDRRYYQPRVPELLAVIGRRP